MPKPIINKLPKDIPSAKCIDIANIIIPAIAFPINTPINASFILILNIDASADALHDPVVGSGIPTNSIIPIILTALSFLALPSIFLSIHLIIILKYFLYLKYSINCLKTNTDWNHR